MTTANKTEHTHNKPPKTTKAPYIPPSIRDRMQVQRLPREQDLYKKLPWDKRYPLVYASVRPHCFGLVWKMTFYATAEREGIETGHRWFLIRWRDIKAYLGVGAFDNIPWMFP